MTVGYATDKTAALNMHPKLEMSDRSEFNSFILNEMDYLVDCTD